MTLTSNCSPVCLYCSGNTWYTNGEFYQSYVVWGHDEFRSDITQQFWASGKPPALTNVYFRVAYVRGGNSNFSISNTVILMGMNIFSLKEDNLNIFIRNIRASTDLCSLWTAVATLYKNMFFSFIFYDLYANYVWFTITLIDVWNLIWTSFHQSFTHHAKQFREKGRLPTELS